MVVGWGSPFRDAGWERGGGWTVKSQTAAAGYKEASAGITHSQKLLCSPECRRTIPKHRRADPSCSTALLSIHPSIPSDTEQHPPAIKRSCNKRAFLTGEDRGGVRQYVLCSKTVLQMFTQSGRILGKRVKKIKICVILSDCEKKKICSEIVVGRSFRDFDTHLS